MAIVTCRNCGNPVSDKAERCPKCGHRVEASTISGYTPTPTTQRPANYMVWAVLTTIFCCLPFGIVSIVKANNVNKLFDRGDYAGALQASSSAKTWAVVAAIVGAIFNLIVFFGAVAEESGTYY